MRSDTTCATDHPTIRAANAGNSILGWFGVLIVTTSLALIPVPLFSADDGPLSRRNLSKTPELHSEHASIGVMPLYVPAQNTLGELVEIEYYMGDCTSSDTSGCSVALTRTEAKPLVATFLDGEVEFVGDLKFTGHGQRDAFAALSLDDGNSWKTVNLSRSGDLSSFALADGTDYAGDVFGISMAVVGSRVLVAWQSRYCDSGKPLYSWPDDEKDALLAAYPELGHPVTVYAEATADYELYVDDLFGAAGAQRSSHFADEGYPEVGEVPYACLWTARGTLEQAADEGTEGTVYTIVWRAPERVTSGVHDVNLVQVSGTRGAGFVVTWQEDPDGLRPGKGLCADDGFNGAIAHQSTDIWYSYVSLDHFDDVCLDDPETGFCTPGSLSNFELDGRPRAAVPAAVPLRLTDSNLCSGDWETDPHGNLQNPYCYADFDDNGIADLCAGTDSWTNPEGEIINVCVTEDGRTLTGRTASTRVRAAMKPYDSDGDNQPDSAWVLLGSEETKAMADVAIGCDPSTDPECFPFDIGKNIWYRTFEFDRPDPVTQGLMLNAPALSPDTGEPFEVYVDEWGNDVYDTEIARRFNLFVNSHTAATSTAARTAGILIYKQGIVNQGGPADIFLRRIVLPEDFDPGADNPFAYENVECVSFDDAGFAVPVDRLYPDGVNPNYLLGLCPLDGMNVSGTTLVRCSDDIGGEVCANQFPFSPDYEEWSPVNSEQEIPAVLEWSQTVDNLNDSSWINPWDISTGAQGFIDGDFVMMMYASAANWKASTIGREAYQLYVRRSFDGGQTWTTLPADYSHWSPLNPDVAISADGTTTCETFGGYTEIDYQICTFYSAGEFEPARNLSLLTGTKVTVLTPRHSPTGGNLKIGFTNLLCFDEAAGDEGGDWVNCGYAEATYPEDIRDPSAFFVSHQTGDNRVVDEDTGPAPLDMLYSRASNFGDDYDVQDVCANDLEDPWYPNLNLKCEAGETDFRFDWLEFGKRSKSNDAEITATPDGSRLYAVWSQEDFNKRGELVGSDAWWRRVFYNLDSAE